MPSDNDNQTFKQVSRDFLDGIVGSESYREQAIKYIKKRHLPGTFQLMASIRGGSYTYLKHFAREVVNAKD